VRPIAFRIPAVLAAAVLAGTVLTPGAASAAALSCAPDPYEVDTQATAAPLAVGATVHRAICQSPVPQPGTTSKIDGDYFAFTATGGTAYTVEVVDVGSALVNDAFDLGGLGVGLWRQDVDGTSAGVEQIRPPNGDRVITPVLPAGRYIVHAGTRDTQIYPETNTIDVKTVQGDAGRYGVRLTESAPAPEIASFTLSSASVKGGKSLTGTYTLTAPAPTGGMYVDVDSTYVYNATPGRTFAPAGATRVSFPISTRASSTDLQVTLTASARVGATRSASLTVRR
jgi:hypothetical protein